MKNLVDLTWKVAVTRGVLGIVFGVLLAVWPWSALVFLVMWGVFLLFDAVGWFTTAFARGQSGTNRVMAVVLGILAVLAAFFAILQPGAVAATLVIFLGAWLIIRGVLGAVVGISGEGRAPRALVIVGALLDILLGVLFFLNPLGSASVIVVFIGITMILWGIVFVVIGVTLRRAVKAAAGLPGQGS